MKKKNTVTIIHNIFPHRTKRKGFVCEYPELFSQRLTADISMFFFYTQITPWGRFNRWQSIFTIRISTLNSSKPNFSETLITTRFSWILTIELFHLHRWRWHVKRNTCQFQQPYCLRFFHSALCSGNENDENCWIFIIIINRTLKL